MYNLLTSCNIVISGREVGPGLRKWNEGRPDEERQMQQRNYSHVKVADKKKEKYIRREIRVWCTSNRFSKRFQDEIPAFLWSDQKICRLLQSKQRQSFSGMRWTQREIKREVKKTGSREVAKNKNRVRKGITLHKKETRGREEKTDRGSSSVSDNNQKNISSRMHSKNPIQKRNSTVQGNFQTSPPCRTRVYVSVFLPSLSIQKV